VTFPLVPNGLDTRLLDVQRAYVRKYVLELKLKLDLAKLVEPIFIVVHPEF